MSLNQAYHLSHLWIDGSTPAAEDRNSTAGVDVWGGVPSEVISLVTSHQSLETNDIVVLTSLSSRGACCSTSEITVSNHSHFSYLADVFLKRKSHASLTLFKSGISKT